MDNVIDEALESLKEIERKLDLELNPAFNPLINNHDVLWLDAQKALYDTEKCLATLKMYVILASRIKEIKRMKALDKIDD